jgi:hypothetical protein
MAQKTTLTIPAPQEEACFQAKRPAAFCFVFQITSGIKIVDLYTYVLLLEQNLPHYQ